MIDVNAGVGYRPARGLELFEAPLCPDPTT
jgi:hypothetical protein